MVHGCKRDHLAKGFHVFLSKATLMGSLHGLLTMMDAYLQMEMRAVNAVHQCTDDVYVNVILVVQIFS